MTFINQGTLEATGNAGLGVSGLTGNVGTAILIGSGAVIASPSAGPDTWSTTPWPSVSGQSLQLNDTYSNRLSTINASNGGAVFLYGNITQADVGNLTHDASSNVYLGATLTGGLTLNAATGSWQLAGGTIDGGTYKASGGAGLVFTLGGGTLDGVTADSDLDLTQSSDGDNFTFASVINGLTLDNANLVIGDSGGVNFGQVSFAGTQTLSVANGATGSVIFGRNQNSYINASGGTLTFGTGLTVTGGYGVIKGDTVVNDGTISAASGGGQTVTIDPVGSFTNNGTLSAVERWDDPRPKLIHELE